MKITKYSFRDNKIIVEELEAIQNIHFGVTSYRIKGDTRPFAIRENQLDKLRESSFLTYYTFDKSFTKKDYLILVQDYLEESLKRYDAVINKATQDKAETQDRLLVVYNERIKIEQERIKNEEEMK